MSKDRIDSGQLLCESRVTKIDLVVCFLEEMRVGDSDADVLALAPVSYLERCFLDTFPLEIAGKESEARSTVFFQLDCTSIEDIDASTTYLFPYLFCCPEKTT